MYNLISKVMKKKIFAAVTALCLMAGTSVFAQQQNKPDAPKERPTAEQMAQRKTDRMTEQLKLNEAQAKQVYAINLAQIKEMIAQREKMEAARKAEAEKMKSDPDDRAVHAVVADAAAADAYVGPARSRSAGDAQGRQGR